MSHKWTAECEPLIRLKNSEFGWENIIDPRELSVRDVDPRLLKSFVDEVHKAFPLCNFAEASRGSLWVYHPNKPLFMVWI